MSRYAYTDRNRTNPITYEEAIELGDNRIYYCPGNTPNGPCRGHMRIRRTSGIKSGHFFSTDHSPGCDAHRMKSNSQKYDGKDFSIDTFFSHLLAKKQTSNRAPRPLNAGNMQIDPSPQNPHTLGILYPTLKELSPDEMFGSRTVGELLFDQRSRTQHQHGIWSIIIIEACFNDFPNAGKSQKVVFSVPYSNQHSYKITCRFSDKRDYISALRTVYNNRNKCFAVIGDWKKTALIAFIMSTQKERCSIKRSLRHRRSKIATWGSS